MSAVDEERDRWSCHADRVYELLSRQAATLQTLTVQISQLTERVARIEHALWDNGVVCRVYWLLGVVAGAGALAGVAAHVLVSTLGGLGH